MSDTIKIKKIKNKKNYLDETVFISRHYKQLVKNPNKKIMSYIKERTCLMLGFIIYVILVLIIFNNGPILTGFLIGLALLAVIVCLKDINSVHNYISTKSKKETDTIVVVDESKIVFKNNNEHITYEFEWDYVKYIIISKYCISVISANEENTSFVISIPIDYKEECLRIFEKYNKMDLIVENKKRKK